MSSHLLVHVVLEWGHNLSPSWVVLWQLRNAEDLAQLDDVSDLNLLEFEVGVEDSVVELTEEAHRVSSRHVLLRHAVDVHVLVDLRAVVLPLRIRDLLEVVVVLRPVELVLELLVVLAVVE